MMPLGREFCEVVHSLGLGKTVIEVGSKAAPGQEGLANLRTVFHDAQRYVGVDQEAGPGVDLVCDAAKLGGHLGGRRFEVGLCLDTLEHCRHPETVLSGLASVSRHLVLRVPFCAPIHLHPDDYWRFTPSLVFAMVADHYPAVLVAQDWPVLTVPHGQDYDWPHGVYAFGTPDEDLRNRLVIALQQRPIKNIMVVKTG